MKLSTRLVGIAGHAGAGKTEASKVLSERSGIPCAALADPIKELVHALLGWGNPEYYEDIKMIDQEVMITRKTVSATIEVAERYGLYEYASERGKVFCVTAVIYALGLTPSASIQYMKPRHAYQRFGTDYARNKIDTRIWVDLMPECIISDIRFENEAAEVRARGGVVVVIQGREKTQRGGGNDHESEALFPILEGDIVIDNSGSIEDLERKIKDLSRDLF